MADLIFNNFLGDIGNGTIDWDTDSFKCMLVTATYTPDIDTHINRDDVSNEVVGTGYTLGGAAMSGEAVTVDNTNDWGKYDADNVQWVTSTITARAAIVYKDVGTAATDILVGYWDFGGDIVSTADTFTVTWGANGLFTLKKA